MSFLGIEKENILSMQPNPKYFKEVGISIDLKDLQPATEEEKEGFIQRPESMGVLGGCHAQV